VIAANAPYLAPAGHDGTWYRSVDPRFVSTAIATGHTRTIASRYSAASAADPGFEILYLAENHLVARFEAQALFGSPLIPGGVVAHPAASVVTLAIQVRLTTIVDLADPSQCAIVNTNAQELTGDWRGYRQRGPATSVSGPTGRAPTQEFGEQLFAGRPDVQGFQSLSARLPYYRILAVFPQRLRQSVDFVRYTATDASGQAQLIQIP
jgi:hypothetical protein